ncbi:MAG: xylose isomerase [Verrucomicrobiota bacterium]|nr:xylose isomerase [Verrucomicrobiota bacterium]
MPKLKHIANLWSFGNYPTASTMWSRERQLEAVKEAGFDGITFILDEETQRICDRLELSLVGYFSTANYKNIRENLKRNKDLGAYHINVQLGDENTPTEIMVPLAVKLIEEAKALNVEAAVEVHRDTGTETPEKTYALADAYFRVTGELLPITWDFSHLAVIKHLFPPFWQRLLLRPDLVERAQQFHLRPFNGQHCQVPVTDGKGNLSLEMTEWLPFLEKTLEMWWAGNKTNPDRELFVVPEMGPIPGGYGLSCFPPSWEDAVHLRKEIQLSWEKVTKL